MSKVSAFSTRARQRGSQCCAARLISGNGCSGNEGRAKGPHKRNKGKAGWRKKMESRNGEAPSPLDPEEFDLKTFRSTYATSMLRRGFDVRTVQHWMGHK